MRTVPTPPGAGRLGLLLAISVSIGTGLQAAAQWIAHELDHHSILGPPAVDVRGSLVPWVVVACLAGVALWLTVQGARRAFLVVLPLGAAFVLLALMPIYPFPHAVQWIPPLWSDPVLRPVAERAVLAFTGGFLVSFMLALCIRSPAFPLRRTASQGSARWGTPKPLLRRRGLPLGMDGPRILRYDGDGHLLTLAPTRSGKGTGPIISTLLSYPGSVVVTDPKGENYAVTHAYREKALGHRVVAFDPFGIVGGLGAVNPLDAIDPRSPRAIDDARRLAESIIVSRGTPTANAAFFEQEAEALLSGFILHVAEYQHGLRRSLATVRELLTQSPDDFEAFLEEMASNPLPCHGLLARTANRILQKDARERSGVISTAQSHTHFLDSPQVARALASTTIPLTEIKHRLVTLYLIVPVDLLDAYAGLLRLIVASVMNAFPQDPTPPAERVLILLDEFANLGRLDAVQRGITLLAGFGISIWMFVQDLPQLRSIYGPAWEVFLDVDIVQAFGVNDLMTAKHLSELSGDATVHTTTQSTARTASKAYGNGQRSLSVAEKQRRLLTPDEVRRLSADEQILFMKGHLPIKATKLQYFTDPELRRRAAPNPYIVRTTKAVS